METPCLFSDIISRTIKVIARKNFNDNCFSHILCQYIGKYIRKIIKNTIKYTILTKKNTITIFDIKIANKNYKETDFVHQNQIKIKFSQKKGALTPRHYRKKLMKEYPNQNPNIDCGFFFISKEWCILDFSKSKDICKYKFFGLIKSNCKNFFFDRIILSLLPEHEFVYYKYIISKFEEGNFIEKDYCLESLSKCTKIDVLLPYLILYLNTYISENNYSFFCLKMALKITRSLLINKLSNINIYIEFILPLLVKCLIENFSELSLYDNFSLKKYAANVIRLIYLRLGNQSFNLYMKIVPVFLQKMLNSVGNIQIIYGSLIGISVLGLKNTELVLFPYLHKVLRILKFELSKKKIELYRLLEIKHLYYLIMSILVTYCVKKRNKITSSQKKYKETELFDFTSYLFIILKKMRKVIKFKLKIVDVSKKKDSVEKSTFK
nr:transcriotion associated factor [Cryptomonas sp.]